MTRKPIASPIHVSDDNDAVAREFATTMLRLINERLTTQPRATVCLSGGTTPTRLFEILATEHASDTDWSKVELFWGDERCVPPTDEQSNYGVVQRLLIEPLAIPAEHVHRIQGEANPVMEVLRYDHILREKITTKDREAVPVFDILILGMGADGHTASIFPHQIQLWQSRDLCEIAEHPESKQQRISITGAVINAAAHVFLLTTGASKADVLAEVVGQTGKYRSYPVSNLPWERTSLYVDRAAAAMLPAG